VRVFDCSSAPSSACFGWNFDLSATWSEWARLPPIRKIKESLGRYSHQQKFELFVDNNNIVVRTIGSYVGRWAPLQPTCGTLYILSVPKLRVRSKDEQIDQYHSGSDFPRAPYTGNCILSQMATIISRLLSWKVLYFMKRYHGSNSC